MEDHPFLLQYVANLAAINGTIQTDALSKLLKVLELEGVILKCSDSVPFSTSYGISHSYRSLRSSNFVESSSSHNTNLTAILLVILCLVCAGLASGLTQGLLSLDLMEMKIKSRSGTPNEKFYASKVIPVISRHHFLLVTLMLWNASATEALPVFLSCVVPEYLAIIISVTMILFVGEIIPTAILTGPKQLQIAANLVPLVYLVNVIFFPVAYPISLVLDWVLGDDEGMTVYTKKEIATLMILQHEEGVRNAQNRMDSLHFEEVSIIDGALKFRQMLVSDVMTPLETVFMLSYNDKLTAKTLSRIFQSGFSRIPVYERDVNDVIGVIRAKDLIFVKPEENISVSSFVALVGRVPLVAWHDDQLGETLASFRKHKSHIAVVRNVNNTGPGDPFYEVVGIITLEDIIEEIVGTEIEDDTDYNVSQGKSITATATYERSNYLARLQLLHKKFDRRNFTKNEIEAIASHLLTNVRNIKDLFVIGDTDDFDSLCQLVRISPVHDIKRNPKDGNKSCLEDIYRRDRPTCCCALVLSGTVEILTGATRDRTEKGPWTVIGAEALTVSEGMYSPDFTATALSDSVHLLMLNIHTEEACNIIALQKRKSRLGIHTRTSPKRHQSNYPYLHKMRTYSPTQATSPSNLSVESTFSTSSTLPVNQYGSLHQASPGGLKLDLGSINFSSSLDSEDMENDIGIRLQDIVTEKGLQNGRNMKLISHNNYKSNSINIISNGNNKSDNNNQIIGSNDNNVSSNGKNNYGNKNNIDDNMDDIIDTGIDVNVDKNGMNCSAGIVKGISLLNPFKSTPYGRLPINDNDIENI